MKISHRTEKLFGKASWIMLFLVSLAVIAPHPAHATNLLTNPTFEGTPFATSPFTIAPYWAEEHWGGADVAVAYGSEGTIKHDADGSSQRIEINTLQGSAGVIFLQPYNFTQGHYYQGSMWLRAASTMTANISLRESASPYTTYANCKVTVQPYWQQFYVSGTYSGSDTAGRFQVSPTGPGVLYVDGADLEDTTGVETNTRQITFSGQTWNVRDSGDSQIAPPGGAPNYWNNSTNNVWVDGSGYLHLMMTRDPYSSKWYCADVSTVNTFALGTYQFWVTGPIDALGSGSDPSVVFAAFSYNPAAGHNGYDEVDMEFTKWSTGSHNADFNVWPKYGTTGLVNTNTRKDYDLTLDDSEGPPQSTLRYARGGSAVWFNVFDGHVATDYNVDPLKYWEYDAADDTMTSPPAANNSTVAMPVHIDLFNYINAPTDVNQVEVVINRFDFVAP